MAKKTYVLDTNVPLTDPDSLYAFENNDILLPFKVLEELDKHKKRQDGVGRNARETIRILDSLREAGSLNKGVRLGKGMGVIKVIQLDPERLTECPDIDLKDSDNEIICCVFQEQALAPRRKHIVVSRDVNMRVKCDSLGVLCEDYIRSKVVKDTSELYTGFSSVLVDDEVIDQLYNNEEVFVEETYHPNQFLMLVSNANEKKTALARFIRPSAPLQKVRSGEKVKVFNTLSPRNKEQAFAINLLFDDSVNLVSLIGKAGTGKTLTAIAAGLDLVLGNSGYNKLIVSRPVMPMGRDIGFLPGTLEEKMMPWLAPVQDNLETLLDGKENFKMFQEKGIIEIEALTYIRGRSINNAFIVIDEAQNLTMHEIKTIITRVGNNTKIILTGDIEQIDNDYTDETSNGLAYAVEKFKEFEISGHVTLVRGERSKIATLASKIL
jgi:PhoH-like ATPase